MKNIFKVKLDWLMLIHDVIIKYRQNLLEMDHLECATRYHLKKKKYMGKKKD